MQWKKLFQKHKENYTQILEHYNHPTLDSDRNAWQEVLKYKDFSHGKIIVIEIARLKTGKCVYP